MADPCPTSDLNEDHDDVSDDDDDDDDGGGGGDNDDDGGDDGYNDGRLVGRRPGDVASCFASAGKVFLPSSSFPCIVCVHKSLLL